MSPQLAQGVETDPSNELQSILSTIQDESDWAISERVASQLSEDEIKSLESTFDGYTAVYANSDPANEEGYLQLSSTLADLLIETGFGLLIPISQERFSEIRAGLSRMAEYGDENTIRVFVEEIIRRSDIVRYTSSYDASGRLSSRLDDLSNIELNLLQAIRNGASQNMNNSKEKLEMVNTVIKERMPEEPEVTPQLLPKLRGAVSELATVPHMLERLFPYTTYGLVDENLRNPLGHRLGTQIRNLRIALNRDMVDLVELERWMLGIMDSTVMMMDGSISHPQIRTVYDALRHIGRNSTKEQIEWWLEILGGGGKSYDECVQEYIPEYHTINTSGLRKGEARRRYKELLVNRGFEPDSQRVRILMEQLLSRTGDNWRLTNRDCARLGQRYLGTPRFRVPDVLNRYRGE